MWRRLLNLWLLVFALPVHAQSWDVLRGLKPGDRVLVRDTAGKQVKGKFTAVSDDAIRLTSQRREISIEKVRVRHVKVPSSSRRLRNGLIGAGIGLAVGVTIDQTLGAIFRNESGQTSSALAATYIAPIAVFGGIAAALPAYKTIYKAR